MTSMIRDNVIACAEVLIAIPAFNEVKSIAGVLTEIQGACTANSIRAQLIVFDDGSTDGTAQVAKETCLALVVRSKLNRGYDRTLQHAIRFADYCDLPLVFFDADGQHNPRDLVTLMESLKTGVDIVIASRFRGSSEVRLKISVLLVRELYRSIIKFRTGYLLSDPTSGNLAMSRKAVRSWSQEPNPSRFTDAPFLIHSARCHLRIVEVSGHFRLSWRCSRIYAGIVTSVVRVCRTVFFSLVTPRRDHIRPDAQRDLIACGATIWVR